MVKMEPGLGKVLGNLFDQAYHTQLGVTVARNHPELGRSDLKEVMIRTAQDLAQRDANSYAARIASYGLKLDEDERDSLLEGKIPENFIYGRTQLIKKEAYKTILDFIKKAYDQELKSDLRSALTYHLEENLLQGEYDKEEDSPYDSIMFYVHASPEQVYRSLFAQEGIKEAVPEAFKKLEMFDVENYLRHSFDDERQADLMSQAFKQVKAG